MCHGCNGDKDLCVRMGDALNLFNLPIESRCQLLQRRSISTRPRDWTYRLHRIQGLAFRGSLLRRLISANFDDLSTRRFTWLSFVVSSVLFGALHGRWLAGTVAGLCSAWAMYRRSRVEDAIIAHPITNALIAADVLSMGNWGLWG